MLSAAFHRYSLVIYACLYQPKRKGPDHGLDEAILFGQLVNAAYAVAPDNLANRAGEIVPAGLDANLTTYQVAWAEWAAHNRLR